MKLYKYEFISKQAFTTQINKLKTEVDDGTDEASYFVYNGVKALIPLGFIQIGTDEQGEPVLSEKYCVDILWENDEQAENFASYEVFPNDPKHKILGW